MSRKIRRLLGIVIALIFVFVIGLLYYLSQRTIYNTYNINGNTAGNLYNNGIFCESNGIVYFANPSDNHNLYSMSPNENDFEKLSDDTIYYINADDNYLYYARNNNSNESSMSFINISRNSLCRMKLNGKNLKILDDQPCSHVALLGNELYYLHYDTQTATTLYHVGIDGEQKEQVQNDAPYPCSALGNTIYYAGVSTNHNIYSLTTGSNASTLIYEGNCWMPIADENFIYFMNCDQNYRLYRLSRSDNTVEALTDTGVSTYNVYGNYVFYQTIDSTDSGLYLLNLTNDTTTLISQGNYENICVTSSYVYFNEYGNADIIYHTPYTGGINVQIFNPEVIQ